MESFKLYNVKCGVWHSHTFSQDAQVLIVENRDTHGANSPFVDLTVAQREDVGSLTYQLWGS